MITVWGKPFSFNGQPNPTTYSCDWESCVDKCYDDTKCLLVHTDSSQTCVVYTIGDVQLVSNQKLNPSSSKDKTTFRTFYEPVDFEIAKLRCQAYGNGFMIATASLTQKVVNDTIERNKNRDSIPEQDFLHIGLVLQDDNTWVWTTPELDYKSEGIPWASGEPKPEK
ncbi:hypothetical protein GCK72_020814 [Caenorhabditis remanei]|uniref:PAN-3 domain-containing protein n=1 Tax=Caenorhabditis remanei TaxID=31234 RepID=A0A6A5GHL0_CAERE|nr:hypothetical protein GCK72_020814 [Caenorhabditis remanei]KAF1754254.1 hypothetical protein GCK72_020814 [Caenorhabditis remanei]